MTALLLALLGTLLFAPPGAAHDAGSQLLISARSDRSAASSLSGAAVSGAAYVFLAPEAEVAVVEFWLDNEALSGKPRQRETQAPFDFAGGTATSALPFDTSTLSNGAHVISARVTATDGHVSIIHTNFTKGTTTAPPSVSTLRINAGGPAVTTGGVQWSADQFSVGGKSYANSRVTAISGTTDDALYLTERSATANLGSFGYAIPAATSGSYTVTLHFAEIYHGATGGGPGGAGKRVFSVNAEGGPVELANYDIFAQVGAMAATTKTMTVQVSDGTLDLAFTATVDQPKVSAIEVTGPSSGGSTPPPPSGDPSVFSWETKANAAIGRSEAQGAIVDGKVYVFGGFSSGWTTTARSDAYDIAANTWSRLPDMPEELTHAAVVVDGKTIWLVGGYVGDHPGPSTRNVWKFDTTTQTWTRGPALPAPRGAGGAAIVGRQLYFFSGTSRVAGSTADPDQAETWALNLDGGTTWTAKAPMPNPRNHVAAAAVDGKVYAIGGQYNENESSGLQSDVHRYDPAANTWQKVASLPVARSHSVAVVQGGQLLVVGGTLPGNVASPDVTSYSPRDNVWSKLPSLPSGRKTPVAAVSNGTMYVTGGSHSVTTWAGRFSNRWEASSAMPVALGEVAGGTVGKTLYLVGESNNATLALDLSTGTWKSGLAVRPYPGHHHAAEVINGRLHLFGGLGSGAGKQQIYDPATNKWTLGPDMPFAAGSSASALIGGKVYVAGGIVGSTTTTRSAVYDPALQSWKEIAQMPQGRNHAAAATDGSRLFVAGGRGAGSGDGNSVANGFNTLQVYNPATNTWQSSSAGQLAALPQARGGMGKGVFYKGEMYVMGGETLDGAGATSRKVYNRVDIYNPATNTWRTGTTMPVAKHGIFPLLTGNRITVAGGGVQAGFSSSATVETYNAWP